ncbi:MAG: trypsin-like peptidase domain-containing protein [Clostridia bacterium]|nr:trypsin-like peptidase domain-containing protein [Clostridia bacterium]
MKRLKTLIVILAVFLSCLVVAEAAERYSLGDVNGDSRVLADDARLALRASAMLENLTAAQKTAADVDSNGQVLADDARKILRVSASLDQFESKKLTANEVYELAKKYTVEVRAYINDSQTALGSGFFISYDGKIVTNYHVIDGAYMIYVRDYSDKLYPVTKILAYDENKDIAILKIDASTFPANLNTVKPKTGDTVYTLGSSEALSDTFSNGIVSNPARVDKDYNPDMTYIQITAPISHGNSGGPLINDKGEVIGINTWGYTDGQNLNFAIPAGYINTLDMSRPMSVSDFAAAGIPSGTLQASRREIYICKGGTCLLALTANISGGTVVCEWDGSKLDIISQERNGFLLYWIDALVNNAKTSIRFYVENNPSISLNVPVTVSDSDGWADYGGFAGIPDFGALVGVSPYNIDVNDSFTQVTFSYSAADVAAAGYRWGDIWDTYWKYIAAFGFEFKGYTKKDSTAMIEQYINNETGTVMYFARYFKDSGDLYLIEVHADM